MKISCMCTFKHPALAVTKNFGKEYVSQLVQYRAYLCCNLQSTYCTAHVVTLHNSVQ
jgi:hypothetical protein